LLAVALDRSAIYPEAPGGLCLGDALLHRFDYLLPEVQRVRSHISTIPGAASAQLAVKAKVAIALQNELGRVPKEEEIEQVTLLARVMYKAVLGLHYKRKEQKKSGQLAIF
jgi:hypothetical protein